MNKFNLLVTFLVSSIIGQTIQPMNNSNVVVNCMSNSACQTQLGAGSCCLYEEVVALNRTTYTCRNKDFVNYYLNPKNYDQISQVWTNPEDVSDRMKVYCRPLNTSSLNFTYPMN